MKEVPAYRGFLLLCTTSITFLETSTAGHAPAFSIYRDPIEIEVKTWKNGRSSSPASASSAHWETRKSSFVNLVAGRSGIDTIQAFDASEFSTKIAAEVRDFDPLAYMDRKEARHMDRFTQFAIAAAQQAVDDAGLKFDEENPEEIGVYIGSGIGGIKTFEEQHKVLLERGPSCQSPFHSHDDRQHGLGSGVHPGPASRTQQRAGHGLCQQFTCDW